VSDVDRADGLLRSTERCDGPSGSLQRGGEFVGARLANRPILVFTASIAADPCGWPVR
jgi:hypothetical protein